MENESWLRLKLCAGRFETLLAEAANLESDVRLHRLMVLLNELELCYLAIALPEASDVEIEAASDERRRQQVVAAFPELGYYHSIWTSPVSEHETAVVSDAAEDLVEILHDVDCALSAERQGAWADGAFEARTSYEAHTGRHLANLRSHLYTLRFTA